MYQNDAERGNPAAGITPTEKYLNQLARRSFLSVWSHPNIFRDQGVGKRGEGAEVCDLLVVFENHVLIFSDKNCAFPEIEDVDLAWRRWYKRAILKSAEQVFGAERWIKQHPDRLYLDRACTQAFPLAIPSSPLVRFHRIVVAHDTTGRRRQLIGGSGSLLADPVLVGDAHLLPEKEGGHPFAVGQVAPEKGYVHVFDDSSMGRVMRTLDTITDFVDYLIKKETFITSGQLFGAFGEEDLLAYYLKNAHEFVKPPRAARIFLESGHWDDFLSRPEVRQKQVADRESYIWDEIIEEISRHVLGGTLLLPTQAEFSDHERMLRVLAREPRVRRRMLARALRERVQAVERPDSFSFRTVQPSFQGDPYYVFVVGSPKPEVKADSAEWISYREDRRKVLLEYCLVIMRHFRTAEAVLGIATENGNDHGRSYDFTYLERKNWIAELEDEAFAIQSRTGWLTNLRQHRGVEKEYPRVVQQRRSTVTKKKVGRNHPCPCGSGLKFKHCHGWNP